MQSLYYSQISQSLWVYKENNDFLYWSDITELITSASAYDTIESGSSSFGVTVGDLRITAFSGSTIVATFPVENTNLYYIDNTFPSSFVPFSVPTPQYTAIKWSSITDSNIYYYIYNTTNSSSYLDYNEQGNGIFGDIITNNTYSLLVSGSGTYEAYLYINNTTSGSNLYALSASNGPVSTSFIPQIFNNYEVTFSVIGTAP